jgi:hypothetical protein
MFDLMWREDILNAEDADLIRARRVALQRLQQHSDGAAADADGRRRAIRTWSLAHGLATLLLHGRIVTALGDAESGLATVEDFVDLAYAPDFSDHPTTMR